MIPSTLFFQVILCTLSRFEHLYLHYKSIIYIDFSTIPFLHDMQTQKRMDAKWLE